jgi:hypothetical protein
MRRAARAPRRCPATPAIKQPVQPHHRIDDAGDYGNIESEQQAAQSAY